MDIKTARAIIGIQERRIRSLNNRKFTYGGYEYEIRYEGGFAVIVSLYRREIGRRNFKYYRGIGCYDCGSADEALQRLCKLLPNEGV